MIIKKHTLTFIALFVLMTVGLSVSKPVYAVDIAAGKVKAEQVCASCHGLDGIGIIPTYPNLAGQYASYLIHSLKAYRSGDRNNPIMAGFSATLSDEDITNLAHYYASLKDNRLAVLDIK